MQIHEDMLIYPGEKNIPSRHFRTFRKVISQLGSQDRLVFNQDSVMKPAEGTLGVTCRSLDSGEWTHVHQHIWVIFEKYHELQLRKKTLQIIDAKENSWKGKPDQCTFIGEEECLWKNNQEQHRGKHTRGGMDRILFYFVFELILHLNSNRGIFEKE